MRPSVCRYRVGRGSARSGFTLLALLLILAALSLLALMAMQLGQDERRSASLVRHDARALAIAEVGMERTRAYLSAVLDTQLDLDKVLDPNNDTDCSKLPARAGGTKEDDDHLPVFKDGKAVVMPGSGKRFMRVSYGDGAYLVRIDDNDDDAEVLQSTATTSNNPGTGNCEEGLIGGVPRNNPVRDRDQTVTLTVVGLYPGTDVTLNPGTDVTQTQAQARKVLRVRVGPQPVSGIIAGGEISMGGTSHVCGEYGDISSTGDVTGKGCVCSTDCKGGPSSQRCGATNACVVQSAGPNCDAVGGNDTTVPSCTPNAPVPPPPPVNVWSSRNAPAGCASATNCMPFYYLDDNKGSGVARVHMWNYSKTGCDQPQTCARIVHPGETSTGACSAACWKLVYNGATECSGKTPGEIHMVDSDVNLRNANPSWTNTTVCTAASLVWKTKGIGFKSVSGCDTGSGIYPGASGSRWGKDASFDDAFEYAGGTLPIPRGIWMVEGSVVFSGSSPNCTLLPADNWSATIMAQGNIVNAAEIALRPANIRGAVLVAGRDLEFKTGNTSLYTCGTSAAALVHEQFSMGANNHFEAQLVVENKGICSGKAGPAIDLQGNATISVPQMPPVPQGLPASVLEWSEASY